MPASSATPATTSLNALDLGFAEHDEPRGPHGEVLAWMKRSGDRYLTFRLLRTLPEMLPIDGLQRESLASPITICSRQENS